MTEFIGIIVVTMISWGALIWARRGRHDRASDLREVRLLPVLLFGLALGGVSVPVYLYVHSPQGWLAMVRMALLCGAIGGLMSIFLNIWFCERGWFRDEGARSV
jgi:hypothetical protein